MNYKTTSARFIIPIEVYNRDVYISLGETDERFAQGLLRYKDATWVKGALKNVSVPLEPGRGRMAMKDGFYIIRLGVFPKTSQDYSVLQHEIFHFVEAMFDQAGLPHHLKYSWEAYAYLIQFLTKEIYERLWI